MWLPDLAIKDKPSERANFTRWEDWVLQLQPGVGAVKFPTSVCITEVVWDHALRCRDIPNLRIPFPPEVTAFPKQVKT